MHNFIWALVLFVRVLTISYAQESTDTFSCPVINTTLGSISGVRQQTVLGSEDFCSYRGIRYAQPPVDQLRFKAPVKPDPWQGVYDASEYKPTCIQEQPGFVKITTSEDCLFLNVFVPNSSICNNASDIAVIVFVYGGGFVGGFANDIYYGPHLLLNKCVILVTFNYRVGVFGFLPLALDEYSGNMGLKDQQLALEWVNDHISAFGGNPKQVTLMGHSAGAASVSFHRLNAKSRSLFKQAYVMSSSALSYYALSESNNKTDFMVDLAEKQGIHIRNAVQLMAYIRIVDADYILNHTQVNIKHRPLLTTLIRWQPCIEFDSASQPFLTESPQVLLEKGVNVPTIYTYTAMEQIDGDVLANPSLTNYLDESFTFPLHFHNIDQISCIEEIKPLLADIRRFYFNTHRIDASQILPFLQLSSFIGITYSIHKEIAIQAIANSSAEIRLLRLNPKTELNVISNFVLSKYKNVTGRAGATHSDDICLYFWCQVASHVYDDIIPQETLVQKTTVKTSKILREILTNFAITGKPVSETASFDDFPLVGSKVLTKLPFAELHSMSALVAGNNPDHEEFKFWWNIEQQIDEIKRMPCNQQERQTNFIRFY